MTDPSPASTQRDDGDPAAEHVFCLAEIDRVTGQRDAARDALREVQAALERVRKEHRAVTAEVGLPPSAKPRCPTCKVEAPCPTARALDGPVQPASGTEEER